MLGRPLNSLVVSEKTDPMRPHEYVVGLSSRQQREVPVGRLSIGCHGCANAEVRQGWDAFLV